MFLDLTLPAMAEEALMVRLEGGVQAEAVEDNGFVSSIC